MYLCCVLQAETAMRNYVGIFKVSNISGKRRDLIPDKPARDDDMEDDSSDSDEDSEDEEEGGSGTPVLQATSCSLNI